MQADKKNKKYEPSENKQEKMVRIRIKPNRAIAGMGKAGEEFEVSELVAMNFVAQGLAIVVDALPVLAEDTSVNLAEENNYSNEEK